MDDRNDSWLKFLLGALFLALSVPELIGYFATGRIEFGPSPRLPVHLVGSDAALIYAFVFLAGAFLLVLGVRGLRSK